MKKSIDKELEQALSDLLNAMNLSHVKVEKTLSLEKNNFIKDVKRSIDEIKNSDDIVELWHVPKEVAENIYAVIMEVVFPVQNDPYSEVDDFEDSQSDGEFTQSDSESDGNSD